MENISLHEEKLTGPEIKFQFYDKWPDAKIALNYLQSIVKNPIVKTVIGSIVIVGDYLYSKKPSL